MRSLGLALLLAACGDNRSPCDYAEATDGDNAVTAESSGIVLGADARSLCGSIDIGHFDTATHTIDTDRYRVTIGGDGKLLVRLSGDPAAAILTPLAAKLFDTAANPTLVADVRFRGDHAAQLLEVPPGDYDVAVSASALGDLSAPVAYRVELVLDPPCAQATGAPYQETAADNDAIAVDLSATPAVAMTSGTAEPTGLVATANDTLHLAGTIDATPHADSYADRDSFALRTDATANELIVRLDWADAAADLDFYLFDASTLDVIGAGDLGTPGAQEIRAFAVAPSTAYVLWVGGYKGTHAPAPYDVTVCGTHAFH